MKSMGFAEGLFFGMGMKHDLSKTKIFDWNKAAEYIKENNIQNAYAGLEGDWDCTSGCIFRDGAIDRDGYHYLASTWATPTLVADGEEIPCYLTVEENTEKWDSDTNWPDSAVKIIEG
jgi:hypothetical protein